MKESGLTMEPNWPGYKRNYTVPGTGFTCNGQQCVDSEGNLIPANHYCRENVKDLDIIT